jgi:N-acetyl-gamma-glutamylphosphate reductase
MTLKVAVAGASGYVGGELLRLLTLRAIRIWCSKKLQCSRSLGTM